jgi:hypothetical protein
MEGHGCLLRLRIFPCKRVNLHDQTGSTACFAVRRHDLLRTTRVLHKARPVWVTTIPNSFRTSPLRTKAGKDGGRGKENTCRSRRLLKGPVGELNLGKDHKRRWARLFHRFSLFSFLSFASTLSLLTVTALHIIL